MTTLKNLHSRVIKASNEGYKDHPLFDNKTVWLNSKEAAEYLRISEKNLRVKVSRGEIPINGRLGRTWRFRRDALDRLLESSLTKETL